MATYSDGPYVLTQGAHALTLQGAGQGSTIITLPASASQAVYIIADHATLGDLTVTMAAAQSTSDYGMIVGSGSVVDRVTVDGTGTAGAIGIYAGLTTITHSVVTMPPDNAAADRGIYSSGGNTISDTTSSGAQAFDLSDPGATDSLSRVHLRSDNNAVLTDGGSIMIDDAVIDLGTAPDSVGLAAVNFNNSTSPKTITADHVTIVGGGANSRGVWAYASSLGAVQNATINLTNSIVRGPTTSLVADAGNNGSQGGASTATVNVSYTDYETKGGTIDPTTGAGGIVEGAGNLVNVDPGFVSPTDRHLTPGSAVVDMGDPAAGGPTTDLDGAARVVDGDGNGSAIRDLGAYELQDTTAPDTALTSGPSGLTRLTSATFAFTSEVGATFECSLDGAAYAACTSPKQVTVVDGVHTFAVRATDAAHNTDATPATRTWTVDATPPDTSISKAPPKKTTHARVKVKFPWIDSSPPGTFECSVDGRPYAACTSPFKVKVKIGKHTIQVRAVDAAGNADPTPAKVKFKRTKKR